MKKYDKDELKLYLAAEAEKLVLSDKKDRRVLDLQVTNLRDLMVVNGYVTLAGIEDRITSSSDALSNYEAQLEANARIQIFRDMSLEEMCVVLVGFLG